MGALGAALKKPMNAKIAATVLQTGIRHRLGTSHASAAQTIAKRNAEDGMHHKV
jgi:hypothetical protein